MILLALFQRQIIIFNYPLFIPLDSDFLHQPLDLTLFKDTYQASAAASSMDVLIRLFDGTMFGEPAQGIFSDLLIDPRGVALTEKVRSFVLSSV